MTPPVRVVLVDDHTLFRKGLAELLERDGIIKVGGITGSADEARRLLKEQKPDVAIMDLHMPSGDGVSLLKQLRQEGIDIPTLLLTVSDAEEDLANALRAGARGYLLKDMEPDEVVDAVQRAARGETVVAPAMTAKLVNLLDSKRDSAGSLLDQLTQREREILSHLAQGQSNKTIARALNISHDTVKMHVRHILSKLNLSSRACKLQYSPSSANSLHSRARDRVTDCKKSWLVALCKPTNLQPPAGGSYPVVPLLSHGYEW